MLKVACHVKPMKGAMEKQLFNNGVQSFNCLGLGDILKPDLIVPLIETLSFDERLASYQPEGRWTPEEFIELMQSPPFRQQVDSFTYVLRTGHIDLAQFGIDPRMHGAQLLSS